MGYKPTLGGLKKAQEYLTANGFPMPIFQMDIFDDGKYLGLGVKEAGQGRTIAIEEAIEKFGSANEVVDVKLSSTDAKRYIQFASSEHCGFMTGLDAMQNGMDCLIQVPTKDYELRDFLSSKDGRRVVNVARWGKQKPSLFDRVKFTLFRHRYAEEVFV